MCEKSIHHMETNKENTEWHLCSPATGPVAAWRPCERTTCCHLLPQATPHNCCLPTVPHPRSVWLCTQKTRPENLGLALPSRIKDCAPQGFIHWHVPDYPGKKKKKKVGKMLPPPDLLKSTAHSLCTYQSPSQLLPFEYKGPSERKRHLARAFQIKTAKQIFVWKCSKMRFNTLEKQRGDICSCTPYT